MPPKVLLISVNQCRTPYPVFPLGVAHIAAALQHAGYSVEIADCAVSSLADISSFIENYTPDLIGLSLRNIDDIQIRNNRFFADDLTTLTREIKKITDVPLVLGGSGYSLFPVELLEQSGADYGVHGEGETAMVGIASSLHSKKLDTALPGLVYRREGVVVCNPQNLISKTTIYPASRPEWLVKYYIETTTMLNVQTQRGCSSLCCYCTYPLIEGRCERRRNPADVVDEMFVVKNAGGKYFFVVDSVFNSSPDHVVAMCEEMIRRDLSMQWGCFLKPTGLTQDLMNLMKRAGLSHIEFGTDSFSDTVLDNYEKGFTFHDVYNASEYARIAKVHYAHFLISGGPGETEATLLEGFENSKRLKKTIHFPFVGMRIYPGTQLFERAIREGVVTRTQDMLTPVFYVSPQISQDAIFSILTNFSKQSPNWMFGDLPPELTRVVNGLRKKGIPGPLWEFLVR